MIAGSLPESRPSCSTSVVIYTLPPTSEAVVDARMLMSERLGSLSCAYECNNVTDNEAMVEAKGCNMLCSQGSGQAPVRPYGVSTIIPLTSNGRLA
jgi:hypothetical protein